MRREKEGRKEDEPFESYSLRSTTSGAIQHGVPTKLFLGASVGAVTPSFASGRVEPSGKSEEETPKSARRTVPSSARVRNVSDGKMPGRKSGRTVDEKVGRLNVPMDPAVRVKVEDALQSLLENGCDDVFWKAVREGVTGDVEQRACGGERVSESRERRKKRTNRGS